MPRIRRDDMVEVISGNDRGKRGKVLRVIPDKERLVVQGVNLRWKHLRKSQQHPAGGRVRREIPIHISNVMIFDEATQQKTRVGYDRIDGKKVRIARRTGQRIGAVAAAKPAEKAKPKKKKTKAKAKPAPKAEKE